MKIMVTKCSFLLFLVFFIGTSYLSAQSLTIVPDEPMNETNLDARVLTLTLHNETFADATLDWGSFALNNVPSGTSIEGVTYIDPTHAEIALAFDGTDFDSDSSNVSLFVIGYELTGAISLVSNSVTIYAVVEIPTLFFTMTVDTVEDIAQILSLGQDTVICTDSSIIVDAGTGFDYYIWNATDTVYTSSFVISEGINNVVATDQYGCTATDEIIVSNPQMYQGGTYSIGQNGDFISFNDALNNITCAGINGQIIINVEPGIYVEKLYIPNIHGISLNNTIIFKSLTGNPDEVVLINGENDSFDNYTISLNNSEFISFKDITIVSSNHTNNLEVKGLYTSGETSIQSLAIKSNPYYNLPEIEISSPVDNSSSNVSNVTIMGTSLAGSSDVSLIQVKLNNGLWMNAIGTSTWIKQLTLSETNSTIYVRSIDEDNAVSDVQEISITYQPDGSIPYISGILPVNGSIVAQSNITLTGNADVSNGFIIDQVEVNVNSTGWTSATGTYTWAKNITLENGINEISVRSKDSNNNYSEVVEIQLYYDGDGQEVFLSDIIEGQVVNVEDIYIEGIAVSSSNTISEVLYRINGGNWVSATGTDSWSFDLSLNDDDDNLYGNAIQIENGSSNNTFENCIIAGINSPGTSVKKVLVNSDSTQNNNNSFINCTFLNGSKGLVCSGLDIANKETGTVVTGSSFINQTVSALDINFTDSTTISGNQIETDISETFSGINVQSSSNITIDNNKISAEDVSGGSAITITDYTGSSQNTGKLYNNFGQINSNGNEAYGLDLSSVTYLDVVHNSFNISGNANPETKTLNLGSGCDNILLKNNVLSNQVQGYSLFDEATTNLESDYNNFHYTGTNFMHWQGNDINNLMIWQAYTSQDQNSITEDPLFVSDTDLHTLNSYLTVGQFLAEYEYDIDGDQRNSTNPTIGADELIEKDLAVVSITSPISSCNLSTSEVLTIEIENYTPTTLYAGESYLFSYVLNGSNPIQESYTLSSDIVQNESFQFTFNSNLDLTNEVNNEIIIYSELPTDIDKTNDTLELFVFGNPLVDIGEGDTICEGDEVVLGSESEYGHTYSWTSLPSGFSSSEASVVVYPNENITYVLTETISENGCTDTDSISFNVINLDQLSLSLSSDQTINCGDNTQLNATVTGTDNPIYSWSPVNGLSSSSTADPIADPSNTTIYYITVTDDMGCANAMDSVTVNVTNGVLPISLTTSTGDNFLCDGGTSLNVQETGQYEWSTSETSQSIVIGDVGTYFVTLTDQNGCWGADSIEIGYLTEIICNGPLTMCDGELRVLDAGPGMDSYEWSNGYQTQTYNATVAGTYSCVVSLNGCSYTSSIELLPHGGILEGDFDTTISQNQVQFEILNQNVVSASWDFGDGITSIELNPTHTYSNTGYFDVCVLMTDNCDATDNVCKSIYISQLSIEEFAKAGIKIYPNPTSDNLIIEIENSQKVNISVYDLLGKQEKIDIDQVSIGKYKVVTKNLPSGTYLLQIETEQGVFSEQIIKY